MTVREYRGKRVDNGEWIYGSLLDGDIIVAGPVDVDGEYIGLGEWSSVDPDTVGQYTGKDTPNKQKIYNGDHIRWEVIAREYQDHYGDNIPLGHYREFMGYDIKEREGIVKFKDSAYWVVDPNEDHEDMMLAWIGYITEFDESETIKFFEEDELYRECGFQSIEDLIDSLDKIEVIGNIHDLPHFLTNGGAV